MSIFAIYNTYNTANGGQLVEAFAVKDDAERFARDMEKVRASRLGYDAKQTGVYDVREIPIQTEPYESIFEK